MTREKSNFQLYHLISYKCVFFSMTTTTITKHTNNKRKDGPFREKNKNNPTEPVPQKDLMWSFEQDFKTNWTKTLKLLS